MIARRVKAALSKRAKKRPLPRGKDCIVFSVYKGQGQFTIEEVNRIVFGHQQNQTLNALKESSQKCRPALDKVMAATLCRFRIHRADALSSRLASGKQAIVLECTAFNLRCSFLGILFERSWIDCDLECVLSLID